MQSTHSGILTRERIRLALRARNLPGYVASPNPSRLDVGFFGGGGAGGVRVKAGRRSQTSGALLGKVRFKGKQRDVSCLLKIKSIVFVCLFQYGEF